MSDDLDADIYEEIAKLRDDICRAVGVVGLTRAELSGPLDPDTVDQENDWETLKRKLAVFNQRWAAGSADNLMTILEQSLLPKEELRALKLLMSLIYSIQRLYESTMTPFADEMEAVVGRHLRQQLPGGVIGKRREKMKPYVDRIAKTFVDIPPEKRAGRIKKELLKDPGLRKWLPKDDRTIQRDIRAILSPESIDPRMDDPHMQSLKEVMIRRAGSHRRRG